MIITVNTEQAPATIGPYSHAKKIGNFVFTSGQLGVNPETCELAGNTIEAQSEQSIQNIGVILAAAGASFDNVLKTTCYLSDIADFAAFNAVYSNYFTSNPARSCFAVKALPKGGLVEIEAVAVCASFCLTSDDGTESAIKGSS